ncbi:hypothetical protein [Streptomyces sp. DT117]|uniref:hypothetical protein n=1 Tax=Streptomyces sp. DT117 TaxID=3393422 RepID=UPI003CF06022
MRINPMTWIKTRLDRGLDRVKWALRRRKLRDELGHLALHAFYAALDEIDSLEALLEAEQKKRFEIEVEARVAADLRRGLDIAVAAFADRFDDHLLALHEAPRLGDSEVSALAWLLTAAGRPEGGATWKRLHQLAAEPDDIDAEAAEPVTV